MVHVPDEIIMAYADGQVSAEERAWFESMLATDPGLRMRLDPFVATGPGQFSAFDAVLSAPVPDRLLDTIRGTVSVSKKPAVKPGLFERLFPNGFGVMPAVGYAATLLVGVGVGSALLGSGQREETLVRADRDGFVATGRLQVALDRTPSNDKRLIKEGDIRPVLTVRDRDGRVCRQYEIIGPGKAGPQGFACRETDGDWRIRVLTGGTDQNGSAQTVGQNSEGAAINSMVGTVVKSLPGQSELTAAEELFLIEKGWDGAPDAGQSGAGN
jgi:hypothetical protein